jgi:hypothetical protein
MADVENARGGRFTIYTVGEKENRLVAPGSPQKGFHSCVCLSKEGGIAGSRVACMFEGRSAFVSHLATCKVQENILHTGGHCGPGSRFAKPGPNERPGLAHPRVLEDEPIECVQPVAGIQKELRSKTEDRNPRESPQQAFVVSIGVPATQHPEDEKSEEGCGPGRSRRVGKPAREPGEPTHRVV